MERIRLVAASVLVVVLATLLLGPSTLAAEGPEGASTVVLVLAPYMTWDDLDSGSLPTLRGLAEDAALGNLNTRSRAPGASIGSLEQAALMVSSGSWAVADLGAPAAYAVDERYETGDVAEAYRRFMGHDPGDAEVAYLGFPRAQRANEFDTLETRLGLLGQAIVGAGGLTAAVGNSDTGYVTEATVQQRPAALAAMDTSGLVGVGDVSRRLLQADESGPYGLSTDRDRLSEEFLRALDEAERAGGPALIVLDPGDAHRAVDFAEFVSPEVAEDHRQEALETLDHAVGIAAADLPADGMLMVVSTVPVIEEDHPAGLAPCVVYGEGWAGYLRSNSAQRPGLATLTDVPVTVLDALGIERPVEMLGNPMDARAGETAGLDERLDVLREADETAVAVDGSKPPVLNTFIALTVVLIVVATLMVVRNTYPDWLATVMRYALLLVLCAPVATYLMFSVMPRPGREWVVVTLFLATTAAVWVAIAATRLTGSWVRPLAAVSLLTSVVLLADPWLGSPLSFTGYLSYSPLGGARYYGLGNEAAGLLFGSLLVGAALLLDDRAGTSWTRSLAKWGLPVVGVFAVWTAVAPGLGANVGVAAWGVVAVGVMWAAANGVRISWKLVLVALLVMIVLLVLASVLDVGGGGTHLARALESTERGGLEEFWLIVARKMETNLRVLTRTNWAYVLIAVLGLLAVMRWKPRGEFMEALERFPYFSHAMTALLVGGLFAYFTEDSGIVIPALMLLYPGVGVLYLMLGGEDGRGRRV
jgi:hypothetical protein